MVVLDTNALMMPAQLDVRLLDEIERLIGTADLLVPDAVRAELDRLAEDGGPAEAAAANVGRSLADEHARTIATEADSADRTIITLATEGFPDYVVTNDAPLRERVLDAGIPVISLRGRTQMAIIRP